MLDFLVVLGRVPGTNLVITFNELLLAFLLLSARYEYTLHRRWLHWVWYRLGVNYRKRKHQLKTFIKIKRYRLDVWERRQIRTLKTHIRRWKMAVITAILRTKRRAVRRVLRTRRAAVLAFYAFFQRLRRNVRLAIKRRQRAVYRAIYRRYSLMRRYYYSKLIGFQRLERRLKRSRVLVGWKNRLAI
jgi:hypothetical protein